MYGREKGQIDKIVRPDKSGESNTSFFVLFFIRSFHLLFDRRLNPLFIWPEPIAKKFCFEYLRLELSGE